MPGYNRKFLGASLKLPRVKSSVCSPLIEGKGKEIKYTHFSIYLHKERRMPLLAAVNIKGEAYNAAPRDEADNWIYSPQIAKEHQIDNRFYGNDDNTFDRGHVVRRVDPAWGTEEEALQADKETFNWANCTPQHKKLNQKGGIWYQLEQHVMENGVKNKIADVSVFAGPVLDDGDKVFVKKYNNTEVPVPITFWKVITWKKSDGKLYAVGFMMSQWEFIKHKLKEKEIVPMLRRPVKKPVLHDDYFENLKFSDHNTYQVPISAIEKATGIKFDWKDVNFPYKATKYKLVKAKPAEKVYKFSDVTKTYKLYAGKTGTFSVKKQLQKQKPLTKKEISAAVKNGLAGTIKRYELTNVTL